jgi:hypothetical protein
LAISSGDSSSPSRFRWIKSTVRIISSSAYHLMYLKVKDCVAQFPGQGEVDGWA